MPTYRVEALEKFVVRTEYVVEVAEDWGLPVDKNRELADELGDLGVPVGEHVIPSIRSVSLVDTGKLNSR